MAIRLERAKKLRLLFEYEDGSKLEVSFDPKDQAFIQKMAKVYKLFGVVAKEFDEALKEMDIENVDTEANTDIIDIAPYEAMLTVLDSGVGKTKQGYNIIDEVFGAGTADFFSGGALNPEYVLPLLEAVSNEMKAYSDEQKKAAGPHLNPVVQQ